MTTANPRRLADALRACACGSHPLEAGTGLLVDCGSWPHREDPTSRLNDTLPGIDHRSASLVVGAVAHAAGLSDPHQGTNKQHLNGPAA